MTLTLIGITVDFVPNVFTPNGDGQNDIWYVSDSQYPFCAYNAQYFTLHIYNEWGGLVFHNEIFSPTCCPFRSKSNPGDPTIPSINWNGVANNDVTYSWWEELWGQVGAHSGSMCSDGVYFYIINLGGCETTQYYEGFIHLFGSPHSMLVPAPEMEPPVTPRSYIASESEDTTVTLEFILYPNPAYSSINMVVNDPNFPERECKILFFNYQGQLLAEKTYITNKINVLDLNSYQNGFYYLKASVGSSTFIKSFVKSE
jgi:hypothetical protein